MKKKIINDLLEEFNSTKHKENIYIIANTQNNSLNTKLPNMLHASNDEFFSRKEFAEIASAIFDVFGYVKVFYSEIEFIQYILYEKNNIVDTIVYNLSRDGQKEGKKSLIPAFCDLLNIPYTGSDAFTISLLRNKFIYSKYLSQFNVPCPNMCIYDKYSNIYGGVLTSGLKIIKHIHESASIGMSKDNIIQYDENNSNEFMNTAEKTLSCMQSHQMLIQDYIDGIECEVFVFQYNNVYYAADPVCININGEEIITTQISNSYDYDFSMLYNHVSSYICDKICAEAKKIAKLLNIKIYARIDFRITNNGDFYLIDIAGTPYTIHHSSIAFLFKQYSLEYADIYKLIIQLTRNYYSLHNTNKK